MKKKIGLFAIAILSATIALVFSEILRNKEIITEPLIDSEYNAPPIYQAKYTSAQEVIGPDFRIAAKKSVDAVVHIRSQFSRKGNNYDNFYDRLRELFEDRTPNQNRSSTPYIGFGSGVIISHDGYIVTNNHLVEGSSEIEITLNDKRLYEAELIGTDPNTDLALLKIKDTNLPYLVYADSDKLDIGEWVLAVGNPFNLTSTVTAGIVSAKARNINILGSAAIESFIQTDAVINRGNSGGALVNKDGYLVGINAAIASHTGYYEGYSFAIPINIVKKVVADLKKYGEVQKAFMGVKIREITADFAKEIGIKKPKGIYIDSVVDDSGADDAGLKSGDIITKINNIDVNSTSQLLELVGQYHPGDKINVIVLRDGEQKVYNILLHNEDGTTKIIKHYEKFEIEQLGAVLEKVTTNEKNKLGINYGLKVVRIKKGLFKNGGIKEGFIILKINDVKINLKSDFDLAYKNTNDGFLRVEGIYPNGMRIIYGFEL
jgi:Do/DeqQ family serine protease